MQHMLLYYSCTATIEFILVSPRPLPAIVILQENCNNLLLSNYKKNLVISTKELAENNLAKLSKATSMSKTFNCSLKNEFLV